MKTLVILLICFPFTSYSQAWYDLYPYTTFFNFEDQENLPYLKIDTNFNSNGNWQIGAPQKTTFTSAVSSPNVIVTDTVNSYQINDTSSFIITIPLQAYATDYFLIGNYYVDCDSLNDYGKIEYSHDNGATWILIIDDTTLINIPFSNDTSFPAPSSSNFPVLTGTSNGWESFSINLLGAYDIYGMGNGPDEDTALYRFTFISDAIAENRDGLMFDDLQIVNVYAFGLDESVDNQINVYPNPSRVNTVNIQSTDIIRVEVYTIEGRLIQTEEGKQMKTFSVENLSVGQYILKLYDREQVYTQKFIRN